MKVTIKDVTLTDMLQADLDNTLVTKMQFSYDNVTQLIDAIVELENVTFNVANQFENGDEHFVINTSYGRLKLNRKHFHSIIIE